MKLYNIFSILFSILLQIKACLSNAEFDALNPSIRQLHDVDMVPGHQYIFMMYTQTSSADPIQCMAGFKHVSVIVGTIQDNGNNDLTNFQGVRYHLSVPNQGPKFTGLFLGNPVSVGPKVESDGTTIWQFRQRPYPTQFEYKGTTDTTHQQRVDKCDQWQHDHPTYNPSSNNCNTFAQWMVNQMTIRA
ncbi:hypothetical protein G7Y89_g2983 [Cudoniella acicularis]|uniref:Uncharacterized protein n=1 Tax=Cudoniella acicularis TaxID=354080 RepID=A0A8H4W8U5_9HELO|nr:hypothetical protein G7Y89_g2983 [Cudoniella acicularis]